MNGMVLLAEAQPSEALTCLRRAWQRWHELESPHEAARARVLIAQACRALGDVDSAEMEVDAARAAFSALRTQPDPTSIRSLRGATPASFPDGLTAREARGPRPRRSGAHEPSDR